MRVESLESKPLVSIGIPTYNRAHVLRRAVESALAQDYANLELVISDNASVDGTEAVCREFCARDNRVRYIRQEKNRGPVANFDEVLNQSRGEFFMWLSDDDWLDRSYVSQCLRDLVEQPDHALVCGKVKNFRGEKFLFEEEAMNLLQDSGKDRVLAYFRQVHAGGIFFGLRRREQLEKMRPNQYRFNDDWLSMASVAFMGKIRTLENVYLYRSFEGLSADLEAYIRFVGLSGLWAKIPQLSTAIGAFQEIAWASPIYGSMGKLARLSLGGKACMIVCWRHVVPTLRVWIALRTRLRRMIRRIRQKTSKVPDG